MECAQLIQLKMKYTLRPLGGVDQRSACTECKMPDSEKRIYLGTDQERLRLGRVDVDHRHQDTTSQGEFRTVSESARGAQYGHWYYYSIYVYKYISWSAKRRNREDEDEDSMYYDDSCERSKSRPTIKKRLSSIFNSNSSMSALW
jgi:hypothetical protein